MKLFILISLLALTLGAPTPRRGCKWKVRGSRTQMFFKIVVFKNFTNFTRKHLCRSLLVIKLQALRRFQHRCFPVKYVKFLRTTFFTERLQWLLLKVYYILLAMIYVPQT